MLFLNNYFCKDFNCKLELLSELSISVLIIIFKQLFSKDFNCKLELLFEGSSSPAAAQNQNFQFQFYLLFLSFLFFIIIIFNYYYFQLLLLLNNYVAKSSIVKLIYSLWGAAWELYPCCCWTFHSIYCSFCYLLLFIVIYYAQTHF